MEHSVKGIVVFSGGSAANSLVDVFNRIIETKRCPLSYIIPISDNGGSSSELIRVFGGPGRWSPSFAQLVLIPMQHRYRRSSKYVSAPSLDDTLYGMHTDITSSRSARAPHPRRGNCYQSLLQPPSFQRTTSCAAGMAGHCRSEAYTMEGHTNTEERADQEFPEPPQP